MNLPPELRIKSGQGDYSVSFISGLSELVRELARVKKAVVLIDSTIAKLYSTALGTFFLESKVLIVEATEALKSPTGVLLVWEFLQRNEADKQTTVIVIGGGITQDIGQFAAHNYYRGLKWHFVPTTLLSMADSCIGAKCGINLGAFKNQLGVFHAPEHVLICLEFLKTLSDVEIASGYGEILKLLLTRSTPDLYTNLEQTVDRDGLRNEQLINFIHQSLVIKKSVIEEDEYEHNLRRILNFGHTFGHALEAITQHEIPHGIAVAWGLDLVNCIASEERIFARKDFERIHRFVKKHFSWKLSAPVTVNDLISATKRDKKISDGKINLILANAIGSLSIIPHAYDESLTKTVSLYFDNYNVVYWN